MTQGQLAAAASLSQGYVSKVENGLIEPPADQLNAIAAALRYPPSFFMLSDGVHGMSCFHHRKRQSMPVGRLRAIYGRANITRIQATRLLHGVEIETPFEFPRMDRDLYESVEEIAQLVRGTWALPLGPIANLIRTIESAGGIVLRCSFETDKLDALSQWIPNQRPFFFVNTEIPADRLRWTLAHEIGHLVMHAMPSPQQERQADHFAAEFLMPAREVRGELGNLSLPKLAALKQRWKVSMQAIIMRAAALGKITERQKRSLFMRLGQLGYRKSEPVGIAEETPSLLRQVIEVHRDDDGYSIAELSAAAHMLDHEFRIQYLNDGTTPNVRLVK